MNVITAKEARKIANRYAPHKMENALKYVMYDIKETAKLGRNTTEFRDTLTPRTYFQTIKSEEFKKYIESLGYKYEFNSKETWETWGLYSEWVTISW